MSDEFEITIPVVRGEGVGVPIGEIQRAINSICQQVQTDLNLIASGGFPLTDVDITGGTITGVAISNSTGVTQPTTDNSTLLATDAFVNQQIIRSTETVPITLTGGVYNQATLGTGFSPVIFASGGVVQSILTIVNPGSGYAVGDLITLAGGNDDATLRVATLSGSGVASVTVLYGGTGYTTGVQVMGTPIPPGDRNVVFTGTLTSNVTFIIAAGTYNTASRRPSFANNTTGNFTVTVFLSNGADGTTGTGYVLPQGTANSTSVLLQTDGETDVWPINGVSTGPLDIAVTTSGSVAGPVIDNIITSTDTQTVTGAFPIKDSLKVLQRYGGSTVTGNRQAIEGYGLLTAPSQPSSVFRARYYVGGSFTAEAQTGDNGFATTLNGGVSQGATSLVVNSAAGMAIGATLNVTLATPVNGSSVQQTVIQNIASNTLTISPALTAAASNGAAVVVSLGELQGMISQAVTDSGANYFDVLAGAEANITAIGLAPRVKTWLGVGNNSNDAVAGSQWDAAIGVTSASPTVHATTGLLFSPYAGYFPVNTSGALIGAYTGASTATPINVFDGFDFTGVNLTNSVLRGQVNSTAIAASTLNPGLAIQNNLSGGSAEIDLVNTFQSASNTLSVLQKTGANTSTTVFSVGPTGNASVAGTFAAAAGVNSTAVGNASPSTGAFTTLSSTGTFTPSQTNGIVGTTTNNNANAGSVGEYVTATGTAVSLTNNTPANCTSISLTAGDWDVYGSALFNPAGTTTTAAILVGISTTSATTPAAPLYSILGLAAPAGVGNSLVAPSQRISLASTTTVYLVTNAIFAVSNMTVTGQIWARRRR